MPCPYTFTLSNGDPYADIVFDESSPTSGVWWLLDDVPVGWFGSTVEITQLPRAGVDGTALGTVRRTSRSLSVRGSCLVTDSDKWWQELNRLETLLDSIVTADGTLTAAEPTGNVAVSVRYGPGQFLHTRRGNIAANNGGEWVGAFTFSIPLLAASPAKT